MNVKNQIIDSAVAKSLLQEAPATIYILDLKKGEIIYRNEPIPELIIHPDDLDIVDHFQSEVFPHLSDKEVATVEYRILDITSNQYIWKRTQARVYKRNAVGKVEQIIGVSMDVTQGKIVDSQNEDERSQHLQILLDLSKRAFQTRDEIYQAYLQEGCRILQMETGILSRISGQSYEILDICSTNKTWKKGQVFNLTETLCQKVVVDNQSVYYYDLKKTALTSHPIYTEAKIQSYIGTPIDVGAEKSGTLNFSSIHVQDKPLSDNKIAFISLLANQLTHYLQLFETRQALQHSELQYQALYNSAPDMLISTDAQTGELIRVNDTILEKLGYSREELLGKTLGELYPPKFKEMAKQAFEEFKHKEEVKNLKLQIQSKTGELLDIELNSKWVKDDQGEILHSNSIFRDISEQVQLRKELEEAYREQFRWLFDEAPDMMSSLNPESGQIIRVNERLKEQLGYTEEELLSMNILDVHPEKYREEILLSLEEFKNSGEVRNVRFPMRKKNGEIFAAELNAKLINRKEGAYSSTAYRDISEQEALRVELEQLMYSVSHDLRAPVRHIEGYIDWIREDDDSLSENSKELMSKVDEAAKRLGSMIDQLLAYSRSRNMKPDISAVDMGELIHEVMDSFDEIDSKPADIAFISPERSIPIPCDRNMMLVVWENLIGNAIKYSGKKAQIHIEIGYILKEERHEFFVKDHGVGFDMAYADKLFSVFQRLHTRSQFEGNGIGLANTQRIISAHGGKIWAEGEVDKGATFYFSLPT